MTRRWLEGPSSVYRLLVKESIKLTRPWTVQHQSMWILEVKSFEVRNLKKGERERVEIGGRKVKWFCQTVTNVTDDKSRGQSQSSVYRPKQRRQPYQTTLGNTISSEDSSRAKGAWVTDSTSPQQLLLPPLGDLGPGTADDEPVDVGREVDTVVDAPDHRTTELGSMLIDSVRSGSAAHKTQSNCNKSMIRAYLNSMKNPTKSLCGRIVGEWSGLRWVPLGSSECGFPRPTSVTLTSRSSKSKSYKLWVDGGCHVSSNRFNYLLAESRLRCVERPLVGWRQSARNSARDSATVGKLHELREFSIKTGLWTSSVCCWVGCSVAGLQSPTPVPRNELCCWSKARICPISRTIRYSNCSSCLSAKEKIVYFSM